MWVPSGTNEVDLLLDMEGRGFWFLVIKQIFNQFASILWLSAQVSERRLQQVGDWDEFVSGSLQAEGAAGMF